jgi:putative transposase
MFTADNAQLPMARGFAYLVAILDLYSRKELSFRVSNAMSSEFCVEALDEALARYGAPEIFNTDQGSQFTDDDLTAALFLFKQPEPPLGSNPISHPILLGAQR